jgi:hypothetical protein
MRKAALLVAVVALLAPASTFAAGSGPDAATVAGKVCARLQVRFGDAFSQRFTSADDCVTQLTPLVQAAFGSCSGQTGATLRICARAARVTGRLCVRLDARAGTRFAARFGDLAGCESTLTSLAQSAIAGCKGTGTPGDGAFRSCLKAAIREGLTKH